MSWFSKIEHAFINSVSGQPADFKIVNNPSNAFETALNATAAVVLPAAAALPGANSVAVPLQAITTVVNDIQHPANGAVGNIITTVGTLARTAADEFLTTHIGTQNTAYVEAGAEALAASAIGAMPSASGKSPTEVANALHEFLTAFFSAPPVATPTSPAA